MNLLITFGVCLCGLIIGSLCCDIALKGKCRHSGNRISTIYLFAEIGAGVLFVWMYQLHGASSGTLIGVMLIMLSVIISVSDIQFRRIPNKVLLYFFPVLAGLRLLFSMDPLAILMGVLAGGGIGLLLAFLTRGGIGMGDVKLMAVYGAVVGYQSILLAFCIACVLGVSVAGILLLLKVIQGKQRLPFGPFLAAGTLIAYAYGTDLVAWFLSI